MAEMTPMQAWKIVSGSLMQLYRLKDELGMQPYTQEEIKAETICFMALKQMEERDSKDG